MNSENSTIEFSFYDEFCGEETYFDIDFKIQYNKGYEDDIDIISIELKHPVVNCKLCKKLICSLMENILTRDQALWDRFVELCKNKVYGYKIPKFGE